MLEEEYQQHLWRTLLPLNLIEDASNRLHVKFTPAENLGATLKVIWRHLDESTALPEDTVDTELGNYFCFSGSTINVEINPEDIPDVPNMAALQGASLLFHVVPLPGYLEDGEYTLEMTVQTENPHPFEVTERYWLIEDNHVRSLFDEDHVLITNPWAEPFKDNDYEANGQGDSLPITNIVQNQFGRGELVGEFTSEEPFTTGSVHVYRFKAAGAGQMTVHTELIDAKVNTNLRVYRRTEILNPHTGAMVSFLGPVGIDALFAKPGMRRR